MNDSTYMLSASCSSPRYLSARSAKSYQTYMLEVSDNAALLPGDEVLASGSDKELMHVIIGHPRHDTSGKKRAAGNLKYIRKLAPTDVERLDENQRKQDAAVIPVSYTHLRAHETRHDIVCRLLLEKKKKNHQK